MESVRLGVIADIQYCDCDDAYNFERTKERFYRDSLKQLDKALNYFSYNICTKILQLGDLLDGKCRSHGCIKKAMNEMSRRFETDNFETFHVVGNHDLYNLSREQLCESFLGNALKKYQNEKQDVNYYKVNLSSEICLIVLDCYEISVLSRREGDDDHPDYLQAQSILEKNNDNESWNESMGIAVAKFVSFNGAIGARQLQWLGGELQFATDNDQIVILAGHIPIASSDLNPSSLLWNNDEVLEIIEDYPCVKAYICGHVHAGNVLRMDKFIHINMPGVIESLADQRAYGILDITKDRLHLSGLCGYFDDITFEF